MRSLSGSCLPDRSGERFGVAEPIVYLNGQLLPASEGHLALSDAGIVQGATITEQARTFRSRTWRLDARLDRLFRSLDYTGITIPQSRRQLVEAVESLVANNLLIIDDRGDLGIILLVTPGDYPTYARMTGREARSGPTVCIHTYPLPFTLWVKKMRMGQHLLVPSIRHVPPQCWSPHIKCRSRMHWFLADQEARRIDPDASALLLDLEDCLTETNTANFFIVHAGAIISPTERNILPGHSRKMVRELAEKRQLSFIERDIVLSEALTADEAFLSSTPYCLMPVTRINGVSIGKGQPGPIYRSLMKTWSEEVGMDVEAQITLMG
jgi:branched-subunit amino acid aminotransferase/4-amino-4-deoxychorismate lyase